VNLSNQTITATDEVPPLEAGPSLIRRTLGTSGVGPTLALVLVCAFFAVKTDRFLTGTNLSLVLQQTIEVGTLAIGQTLIILTAGIDLSCGAVMALGSIVMTKLAVNSGVSPVLAIVLGIAACVGFGVLNGTLVTSIKLPAFIVTLGTLNIAFALTHIYSGEATITGVPSEMTYLGNTFRIGGTGITYASIVMLALFALVWFALTQSSTGRHVYALGDNPEAVRLAGVHVQRLLIGVYATAGLIYGIAAFLLVARTQVGDPAAGQTDNLDSITAVVLGGTSLFGGRGSVIATLIGALIVGIIRNGLTLLGVDAIYQVLITGILVILAVATDQLTRGRHA